MSAVFSRSLRSIENDGQRRSIVTLAVGFALVATWAGWFFFARVAVVEVAETARLEVDQAAYSIEAQVAGTVISSHVMLGQQVAAGDVLVELDTEPLRLALAESQAKESAFAPQVEGLKHEIESEERALEGHQRVTKAMADESDSRRTEAQSVADLAESEMNRSARLRAEGLASASEVDKARAESVQKRAAADGTRLAATRVGLERLAAEAEGRAKITRLRRDLAQLEGDLAVSVATVERLQHDIARRQLRASIAGTIGEVVPTLRVGAVVKEGDKLGVIVPSGKVRVVAEFLPESAVGRIKAGQSAQMRPDGFPWTQYGMLAATVSHVASEPRSGHVRVELDVHLRPDSQIPAQHGLPGTLEIEVERIAPADLVLRVAGRRLATPLRSVPEPGSGEETHAASTVRP